MPLQLVMWEEHVHKPTTTIAGSARLGEQVDAVIGVDTHTDTLSACLVNPVGAVLAEITEPANPVGYRRLLTWSTKEQAKHGCPRLVWAVEGTRSHGAGVTRALRTAGQLVLEATRPPRAARRPGGKSDPKDAVHAARAALANTHHAEPRADGPREALRMLLGVRSAALTARTDAINELKALIMQAPDELRGRLRGLTSSAQIAACRRLRVPATPDPVAVRHDPQVVLVDAETRARLACMRRLARRIGDLTIEIDDAADEIHTLVHALDPGLLAEVGVGPITAAQILISWSHAGRLRSEAAFAALAGVSPLDASSGAQQRHRLNRHGDRALNSALHTIAVTRERCDPRTKTYIQRRVSEGKSRREARRMLKRYLARHIYRHLERAASVPTDGALLAA